MHWGDEVLEVRKFEPTQADSNRFILTDKVFPVFVEDVRDVLRPADFRALLIKGARVALAAIRAPRRFMDLPRVTRTD